MILYISSVFSNHYNIFQRAETESFMKQMKNKIIENYHIGKKIGQGSFSKVHLGWNIETSKQVAIKIISKQMFEKVNYHLFKKEVQNQKNLNHQHIAKLLQVVQTSEKLFLILQYCPNGELFNYIKLRGGLSNFQVKKYYEQLINVIKYLHSNHIAHSDLKPENMMLDENMDIKLIDFGFSQKIVKENTKSLQYFGSGIYSVPQITLKKPYNPFLADIWSFGVCIYTMVTNQAPFSLQSQNYLTQNFKNSNKIPQELNCVLKKIFTGESKRISIVDVPQLLFQ